MERAERTIGSCAAEPCGNEKIGAGETTGNCSTAKNTHWYELLKFLDYLGEIKGTIKGSDKIRKAALHRCRTKHLQSLWAEPKPPSTIRLTSWRLEQLCWEKVQLNTALHQITAIKLLEDCERTVPLAQKNKKSTFFLEIFVDIKEIQEEWTSIQFAPLCSNLSVLPHVTVPVSIGLSAQVTNIH